ncbi:4Fe-4S binding protein [Parasalinivibrio latis]|uniref:4Fe-4S binding protein n=1 Tax=Parasalinivibrio latis TaxID=2952610 RepID=UPI0030DF819E
MQKPTLVCRHPKCRLFCIWILSVVALSLLVTKPAFGEQWQEVTPEIARIFPQATRILPQEPDLPVTPVYQLNELLGYVFESDDLTGFPGFSGETVNIRMGLDTEGVIQGIELVRHHEPIFLHGLGEEPLLEYIAQYLGQRIQKRFIIGSRQQKVDDGSTVYLDGVTKATVSVIVINDTILAAAMKVARARLSGFTDKRLSTLKTDNFRPLSFDELVSRGLVHKWQLSQPEAAQELGLSADQLESLTDIPAEESFVAVYAAVLNSPLIGKNLLGEEEFRRLDESLDAGEIAFIALSGGEYNMLAEDFIPGTSPARFSISQEGFAVDIRDTDFYSFYSPMLADGAPEYAQIRVFRIKGSSGFDPGKPLELHINVAVKKSFLESENRPLSSSYALPEEVVSKPEANASTEPEPLWVRLWRERVWEVAAISVYLALLTAMFAWQKLLAKQAGRYLRPARFAALAFVVGFIGIYAQGQLSVVNIYTLLLSLWQGFDINVFLLDPVIFVLWSYVFVSLFLWGRGLFCGWLCPFGAMQELVSELGKRLGIRPHRIKDATHRRLQWVKYPVLAGLVCVSFSSLSTAETLAEIEPFKTAVTLVFDRTWPFVLYALLLLGASAWVHKAYCRYLCPLGAGLSVLGRLRLFSWLTRREECGSPCQLCHKKCQINAITPQGKIDYNECIQCLECLVIIHDNKQCVVDRYSRKAHAGKRPGREAVVEVRPGIIAIQAKE